MLDSPTTSASLEVHDPEILAKARALLDTCRSGKEMQDAVIAAVKRNEKWRGAQCINLLAPEAPTSPAVRALLSAEVGTRAAEGHIGKVNRWFAGTQYIDEIESLCVELLKQAFRARYADHRLGRQHDWQSRSLFSAHRTGRCDYEHRAAIRWTFEQPHRWASGCARPENRGCPDGS